MGQKLVFTRSHMFVHALVLFEPSLSPFLSLSHWNLSFQVSTDSPSFEPFPGFDKCQAKLPSVILRRLHLVAYCKMQSSKTQSKSNLRFTPKNHRQYRKKLQSFAGNAWICLDDLRPKFCCNMLQRHKTIHSATGDSGDHRCLNQATPCAKHCSMMLNVLPISSNHSLDYMRTNEDTQQKLYEAVHPHTSHRIPTHTHCAVRSVQGTGATERT